MGYFDQVPAEEKIIKEHPFGIEEIFVSEGRHKFRLGGPFDQHYRSLREALQALIMDYRSDLANVRVGGGEFTRRRKRAEIEADVKRILQEAKVEVEGRLRQYLIKENGDFCESLISSYPSSVEESEKRAYEDLKTRLIKAVGGADLSLLFFNGLFPDLLKNIIKELPEGQDPEDVLKETAKKEEESKRYIGRQIEEAQKFFAKAPKEPWES